VPAFMTPGPQGGGSHSGLPVPMRHPGERKCSPSPAPARPPHFALTDALHSNYTRAQAISHGAFRLEGVAQAKEVSRCASLLGLLGNAWRYDTFTGRFFHIPADFVVTGVTAHRKPPAVRIWSLGAGRGALTSPFPHPRVETVRATFTAPGSPGIGDFRSQRYHWVCQVPRVRCHLHRLTGQWMALKCIRDKTAIGPAPRQSPGVLPHVRSFPALRGPMTPPTPRRFLGGQHPSPPGPPTFTLMPSAVTFRRWLTSDPSRSSRYPDRSAGRTG
jgi:hypothetical protein